MYERATECVCSSGVCVCVSIKIFGDVNCRCGAQCIMILFWIRMCGCALFSLSLPLSSYDAGPSVFLFGHFSTSFATATRTSMTMTTVTMVIMTAAPRSGHYLCTNSSLSQRIKFFSPHMALSHATNAIHIWVRAWVCVRWYVLLCHSIEIHGVTDIYVCILEWSSKNWSAVWNNDIVRVSNAFIRCGFGFHYKIFQYISHGYALCTFSFMLIFVRPLICSHSVSLWAL